MKTITELSEQILKSKDHPRSLSKLLMEMATKYAMVSDIYKDLRMAKNVFWQENKKEKVSDKAVEISWHCTEEGEKELRATMELKSLEKLMSSVKSYLRVLENESRNQY